MVVVNCPVVGCTYKTSDEEAAVVAALLNIHALSHTQATAPPKPKLDRPRIDIGVEEEIWNNFVRRWEAFRAGSDINEATAPTHLFQCATEALGDLMLKSDPSIQLRPVKEILAMMRSFAVIPIAKGVIRAELMQLQQSPDETFRTFAARVKGKAETCGFTTTAVCQCSRIVSADYTQETVRDVLLAGIADLDIRREAISMQDIQKKSINDVIAFVEGREMARNATPSSSLSAFSTFKRHKNSPTTQRPPNKPEVEAKSKSNLPPSERGRTAPCPDCGKQFQLYKERANGSWNIKPHNKCLACWRSGRPKRTEANAALSACAVENPHFLQISTITCKSPPKRSARLQCKYSQTPTDERSITKNPRSAIQTLSLKHKIFQKTEWRKVKVSDHPRVEFQLTMTEPRSKKNNAINVKGIADTGAQSNLWGLREFLEHGFSKSDLLPVQLNIKAANNNPINIIGAFEGLLEGKSPNGETISCSTYIYVSDSVTNFYLSYDTMIDLLMIDKSFPTIGGHSEGKTKAHLRTSETSLCQLRHLHDGCPNPPQAEDQSCKCPQRESIPLRPKALPFPPTPENNENMRQWLLNRYRKSTFNTCPHRPLPCMIGPPVEIHVEESAKPKACHTPAPIPLHWQERVQSDLLRDEALGVIEKVPYGEPVTWCHRMVVTRKHDGSPRRTVDLSPLNKFCKRETFASESPFILARRIPSETWKTVTDAWNGYHSVPLRESDRHLTTFITPFGRWRYTRAPQGFLSSGDGYNRRFDAILSEFQRKERCVDDTIFYDTDLETHWWRTIDFLSNVGSAGIVLNPDKFQFAQRKVDFAGFQISEEKIKPLPKYLDAIRSFPTPTSTTDIRSWFGLINQVANYAQLRDAMEHFRPFLSPKYKFFWSPVLDKAFQESKEAIIEAICRGVEIFDITKPTCLRPDWSANGIGYFLLQQHCTCESGLPDCCSDGWKITLAGSRFLNGAEQRYAPIEGEALAIAWALEQTRYFTQGCPNLLVVTDHKPLKKIFGDRTLDEISNTRLFRLKQRTLPWHFNIEHMPGKTNCAADAASRYPSPESYIDALTYEDMAETTVAASVCRDMESISTVSWDRIAKETQNDTVLSELVKVILGDTAKDNFAWNEYARYRDSLYLMDGAILYNDRVVIPPTLRPTILEGLHAAHQGTSSMELRAQSIVFWPGMTKDIQSTRARCMECNKNAPSQAHLPSEPATPPSTPFEQIYADFFDFAGHHYLIVGDRLSGWSEIFSTPTGSSQAGSRGLIACLRSLFSTFGVPEELSSDGGPEFSASTTQDFFRKWGVRHRQSSAYNPQSNGRAEVAVKSAKRLLRANVSPSGTLDNDKLLRALLQLRNTPDPDCNVSPAQIIYGRPIRDAFSFTNRLEKFSNQNVHPIWREAWATKELALRARAVRTSEALNEHSRKLDKLKTGERCFVQNQTGNSPKKWDRTGIIMETKPHDQYVIKIDGSGRLTTRNRRFLRTYKPVSTEILSSPPTESSKPVSLHAEQLIDEVVCPTDRILEQDIPNIEHVVDDEVTPMDRHKQPETAQEQLPRIMEDNKVERLPASLKRLLPHNKEGLQESMKAPTEGGRQLRTRRTTPRET